MKKYEGENRRRLSIDLPNDLFNALNNHLGDLRLKNALYKQLTIDLVDIMEEMSTSQKRILITSIAGGRLSLTNWSPLISKLLGEQGEIKRHETSTNGINSGRTTGTSLEDKKLQNNSN